VAKLSGAMDPSPDGVDRRPGHVGDGTRRGADTFPHFGKVGGCERAVEGLRTARRPAGHGDKHELELRDRVCRVRAQFLATATYCGVKCRVAAWRRARRDDETPVQPHAAPTPVPREGAVPVEPEDLHGWRRIGPYLIPPPDPRNTIHIHRL
jgi:hypothetical protein